MANRCPSCEKFVSLEPGDPELEDITIDGTEVKCTVRLTMRCAECGDDMREYYSEPVEEVAQRLEESSDYHDHFDEKGEPKTEECELEAVENGIEQQEKTEKRKTLYGAEIHYEVRCTCSKAPVFFESHLETDFVEKSEMEECC